MEARIGPCGMNGGTHDGIEVIWVQSIRLDVRQGYTKRLLWVWQVLRQGVEGGENKRFEPARALAQSLGLPDFVANVVLRQRARFVYPNLRDGIQADVIENSAAAQSPEL